MKQMVNAKTEMIALEKAGHKTVTLNGFKESLGYVKQLSELYRIEEGVYESIDNYGQFYDILDAVFERQRIGADWGVNTWHVKDNLFICEDWEVGFEFLRRENNEEPNALEDNFITIKTTNYTEVTKLIEYAKQYTK